MTTYHAAHFTPHPQREAVWRVVAGYLARWVPRDSAVLEVGAAYCHWINNVRAARRVAVDIWPGVRDHVGPGVEARALDAATQLHELGESVFDVTLASNVLEHFEPQAAAAVARGVRAVLKPAGRLVLVQPNFRYAFREYFDDYTHRAVFTDVSLPAMLRAEGFDVEHVEPRFLPYSMRDTRWPIAPWLVRAYLRSPYRPRAGQMLVVAKKV